jgi:hypothetical protein
MNPRSVLPAILALGSAFLAWGCSDSGSGSRLPLPDRFGTLYVYSAYDSLTDTADTVYVSLTTQRTVEIQGQQQSATVWDISDSDGERSWYLVAHGDTVRIWGGTRTQVQYLETQLVFPLEVGKEWTAPPCQSTALVTEARLVPVPGDRDQVAYTVLYTGGCFNDYFSNTWSFVPDIGFVRIHWRTFGFSFDNRTWDLISILYPPS